MSANPYEQDRLLHTYLLFHYGSREAILAASPIESLAAALPDACFQFPVATVAQTFHPPFAPRARALDLGCAVGRSSFELSKIAREVIGIDYSRAFIQAATALGRGQVLPYHRYREAHLVETLLASVPPDAQPVAVHFEVGDAMDLRPDLGDFDLVHAANLLCRLAQPRRLLDRLPGLVRPGGQLVLATPATWLEDYTPAADQPPGPTLDYLRDALDPDFALQSVAELPFLIREHERKYQLSTSQTSHWVRR
jgi:putative 4-mercaptohistidine N1-methyltranferase